MVVRVSNAKHLEVLEQSATERTGIELDVYDGASVASMLATLTDAATDIRFTVGLACDLDVLNFVINRHHAKALRVVRGNLVEARYNGVFAGEFIIETDPTVELSEDGRADETIAITARGSFAYLHQAVLDNVSVLTDPFIGEDPVDGVWNLTAAGTGNAKGQIARRLIAEAQQHTPAWLPDLTVDFDYDADSLAEPWSDNVAVQLSVGASVGDGIRKLMELGLEVQMARRLRLRAFNEYGRHFEDSVVFGAGNILRRERPSGTTQLKSRMLVIGKDNVVITVVDPAIEAALGRPVIGSMRFDSADPTTLDQAGKAYLAQLAAETAALTLPVRRGSGPGQYEPFIDYRQGDWVGHRPDGAVAPESRRILAMTLSQASGTSEPEVELELEAVVLTADQRRQRQLAALAGNAGIGGGSSGLGAASPPASSPHPSLATHDAMGLATEAELAAAIDAHGLEPDPHPGYATEAEVAAAVSAHEGNTHGVVGSVVEILAVFVGGGAPVEVGAQIDIPIEFDCELTGWTLLLDQADSVEVDVWRDAFSAFPPTDADSITGGHEPATSAAASATDSDIADWASLALSAGDVLRLNVDACSVAERITLALRAERS